MKLKKFKIWARNYFGFSQVEIRAMIILMPLILLFLLLNILPKNGWFHHGYNYSQDIKILDSLSIIINQSIVENHQYQDSSVIIQKARQKKKTKTTYVLSVPSNINTADTTLLKEVYGVGSKLSSRIIKYREALGGYVDMDQLHEVYFLDSPVVDRIKVKFAVSENFIPRQIKLDSASLEKLGKHPYLTYQEAKLIIAYRSQHGPLKEAEDLMNIPVFTTSKIRKLKPYLSISGK